MDAGSPVLHAGVAKAVPHGLQVDCYPEAAQGVLPGESCGRVGSSQCPQSGDQVERRVSAAVPSFLHHLHLQETMFSFTECIPFAATY